MGRNETNKLTIVVMALVALVVVMKSSIASYEVVNYQTPTVAPGAYVSDECESWQRLEPVEGDTSVLAVCAN